MVIQEIDRKILEFIEKFYCVTTSHIVKEFYREHKQGRFIVNRKMSKLVDKKVILRDRELFKDYVYYFKKSKQQRHHLLVVDLYFKLLEYKGRLLNYDVEYPVENIRPDAVIKYDLNGDIYLFCVEVHISNNKVDIGKYERLYVSGKYKNYFEWFPVIVFVSDKRIDVGSGSYRFPIVRIGTDLSDFEKVFI